LGNQLRDSNERVQQRQLVIDSGEAMVIDESQCERPGPLRLSVEKYTFLRNSYIVEDREAL